MSHPISKSLSLPLDSSPQSAPFLMNPSLIFISPNQNGLTNYRMLLECTGVHRRGKGKEEEETKFKARLVCVTSGISFLGLAIVNCLLDCGYSVRIIIDNEDEDAKNGLEIIIVRPFNWVIQTIDFIPGVDGPIKDIPRVLINMH
ncbi:hypothetical protein HHK36_001921 [Tetracentron sinense]|uniref:Uncharacterized protein n=1 Tax=Tetracentron sinense TaxID=13715 RepID=A0A834ZY53_TETSI|nr:hypothetical protein HHK36_001921 [Tetracentron sinense]